MKREALYHKTVDILFDAYFNDTLEHGNCYACAVGNIVAANMGYKFVPSRRIIAGGKSQSWDWEGKPYPSKGKGWGSLIGWSPYTHPPLTAQTWKQINSTGYSPYELQMIERAFEQFDVKYDEHCNSRNPEDRMFIGLVAVLDKLKQIHEVDDNEEVKEKFRKHSIVRRTSCVA